MTVQQLKEKLGSSALTEESLQILKKSIEESHPFYPHSLRTALLLKEMAVEEETIACGILHHIPHNQISFKDITEEVKEDIKTILKKAEQLRVLCSPERDFKPRMLKQWAKPFLNQQAENLRRMFFAITKDIRPIFVTLAGRLDEMRNLAIDYAPEEQQERSIVALEILAPLAYGLGLGGIKGELEDLAFSCLYPKEYSWLQSQLREKYQGMEEYLGGLKARTAKILAEKGIKVLEVHSRIKHYFSLYQKLLRHNMDFERIYDLFALRIIVENIGACYQTLGAIHNVWKPLSGRIKDYISAPKANGYQALHTTVACEEKKIIEIQIKTPQMHRESEYGIAAHLGYKEKIPQKIYEHRFYWIEKLRQWREEIKDPKKISEYLQSKIFKGWVFVFTPKGDIINLPKGSTPVDFAYALHSEIGDHCKGAKLNGKIVSLKQALKTGDIVEILIDKNKTPSSDWLRFVKTHKAKQKIRGFLEKAHGISFAKTKREALKEKVNLIKKILPLKRGKKPLVLIGGQTGISVRFSKCCSPKEGDVVAAFITKGEGASLHKTDCLNLKEIKEKWPERIVEARWKES